MAFSAHKLVMEAYPATVLLLVSGAVLAVAAIYKTVALILELKGYARLTTFIIAPESLAFLLAMIGGIMTKWQYTMTAEIVFFAFALVEDSALTALTLGGITPKKASVVCIGLAAISVVFVFVPFFVGRMSVLAAMRDYGAYALALISTALIVCRSLMNGNEGKNNE